MCLCVSRLDTQQPLISQMEFWSILEQSVNSISMGRGVGVWGPQLCLYRLLFLLFPLKDVAAIDIKMIIE